MSVVDAFAAEDLMPTRHWRAPAAALSWPRLAGVILVALLLSTQIFFQAGVVELFASGAVVAGWLQYFAEALASAIAMWLCVAAFERLVSLEGGGRIVATGLVLFAASFLAQCAFLAAMQPPGFFPPWPAIAGDALRWALWGGIVHAAHWQARRHARAAMLLADERVERERADQRRAEADLQLLQAQIQPHFLFNLFAHVRRLYRVGHEDGRHAVERLRSYLKEVLDAMGTRETTLARELELVRAYLSLMKVGLGDRLSFTIEMAPAAMAVRIPPLAVLTLAENAVKHGIARSARVGTVQVLASREAGATRIEVRDDGEGLAASGGTGLGLANTKARLRAMYGTSATLSLDAAPGRGAVAAIEIAAP
jgi:hypothetical protein